MASTIAGAAADLGSSSGLLGAFSAAFGGNKSRMAVVLAGTSDTKSKAYKAAQRNVQRYYTKGREQRKPSKAARSKMAQHVPVQARFQGKFYFDTPGYRNAPDERDRDIKFDISVAKMAGINDALAAGNNALAQERFFEAYGMARIPDSVIDGEFSFEV